MNKEVIIKKSSVETLNIVGGKVNSVRFTDETQNSVRVYENGMIGVAGALGSCDYKELEKTAEEKLKTQGVPYAYIPGKKIEKEIIRRKAYDSQKLLKAGKSLMNKAVAVCPRFNIAGKMEYGEYSGVYRNSEGSVLGYEGSSVSVGLQLKDKDSSNIMDAFYSATFPLYGKTAADSIVSDLKMFHDAYFAEKKKIKSGEYTVIVDKFDILGLLIKDFVAENYVGGGSILSGKLNEKVFSENLSVFIDRNPSTNYDVAFYDGEGTVMPNFRTPLIKNGAVKNILANKNAAKTYGLPQSGTSMAAYDGVPSIGVQGLYVQPAEITLAELTAEKSAIYISVTSGGDMTTDGVVGLPVMLAFLVEKGKITGRVSEFNANGNIFDILGKDFVGVTKDNVFKAEKDGMIVTKMNLLVD